MNALTHDLRNRVDARFMHRWVKDESDCLMAGARWRNRTYNFDDLLQAMLTLFVVSSLDGWVDIM
jgi:hypothetical protein